jgi:hypothetical protein
MPGTFSNAMSGRLDADRIAVEIAELSACRSEAVEVETCLDKILEDA